MDRLRTTSLVVAAACSLILVVGPACQTDSSMDAPIAQSSVALSPATAALADGDDIRARSIASFRR